MTMPTNCPWYGWITVAALAVLPAVGAAQPPAVAAKSINLRAGPARDYPLVLQVGPGTPLAVQGCTDGYAWCDVIVPGNYRGWVYAGNISYAYQDNRVPLLQYGAVIGLPIIGFTLGSYWGDYYRNRPFYRDRSRWEHRPMPQRPGFAGPPPGVHRPGFMGRPAPGGRFEGGARPAEPGRFGGGGRPPSAAGVEGGPRPEQARPDAGRPANGFRPAGGPGPEGGRRPGGGDHGGGRPGGGDHGGEHGGGRPGR